MKRKKTLTGRFLKYLLSIILLSNVLVFACIYNITGKNMTRQALDRSRNLMESNLNIMEQYFQGIDRKSVV